MPFVALQVVDKSFLLHQTVLYDLSATPTKKLIHHKLKFRECLVPDSFAGLFLGMVCPREFSNATGPTGRRVDITERFLLTNNIQMNITCEVRYLVT